MLQKKNTGKSSGDATVEKLVDCVRAVEPIPRALRCPNVADGFLVEDPFAHLVSQSLGALETHQAAELFRVHPVALGGRTVQAHQGLKVALDHVEAIEDFIHQGANQI